MQNPYLLVAILACGGVLIPTLIEASRIHPSTLLIMLSAGSIIVGAILSPDLDSRYVRILLIILAAGMFYAVMPKNTSLTVAIIVGLTSVVIGFNSQTYNTLVSLSHISKPRVLPMVSNPFCGSHDCQGVDCRPGARI